MTSKITMDFSSNKNEKNSIEINNKINKLKKCSVSINTNTCYAECLFMVYKYFLDYFVQSESSLAHELKRKKMNPT